VLGKATVGQPPSSSLYELDVSGQTRIYEAVGSNVTSNTSVGTLTLQHGDASGCSSIMFTSPSTVSNGDYAYIKYQDLSGATSNTGLLTIGIENDPTATGTRDRISLYAAGGSGYVGVNTLDPTFNLDVSGQIRATSTITATTITANSYTGSGNISLFTATTANISIGGSIGTNNFIAIGNSASVGNVRIGGNIKLGFGKTYVGINKDISSGFLFDVSGDSMFRNKLFVNSDASFGTNVNVVGDVSINGYTQHNNSVSINKDISSEYALDVSGQLRIFEGAGTSASPSTGSLILEHTAVGGTSSIMFKGPNSTTTNDYAYVQYTDASSVIQSLLKYDLSSGTPGPFGSITIPSTGTNPATITPVAIDSSFAWIVPTTPINGITPAVCISFNQTNLNLTNTTSRINYLQTSFSSISSFTFSAWIRPGQIAASDASDTPLAWMIANLSNGSGNGSVDIWLQNDGRIYAVLGDDLFNCIRTNEILDANTTWYHLVFTFDGNLGNGFLYLNGALNTDPSGTALNGKALERNGSLLIGMKYGFNFGEGSNQVYGYTNKFKGFRGQMAFVNVFDRGISALDVQYLFENPAYNLATNPHRGLMTIGVENDTGTINNDRIVLWPGAGSGSVGVNTRIPRTALDISGTLNVSSTITSNNGTVIISGQSGAVLRLANQSPIYNSGETLLDFYGAESWRRLGGIGCNDRSGGYNGPYGSSTSFYTTIDTSYNLEAMRITGKSKVVADCATVQVFGDINAISYNASSDYRIKKNVMPLDLTFNVDVLKPVSYVLKDDKDAKLQIGFIAHEVQEVYPFLVNGVKDGSFNQSINYNGFIGILTKEIQVLKKKVSDQEERLASQEAKALEQDARIQALEKMMSDLINK